MAQIAISHGNCMDGLACAALWKRANPGCTRIRFTYPGKPIGKFSQLYWRLLKWWYGELEVVCLDLIPSNLVTVARSMPTAKFQVVDHHKTNRALATELAQLPNVSVCFEPDSGMGAVHQVIKLIGTKANLTEDESYFYGCIAAADMWNRATFPDFIYFNFGLTQETTQTRRTIISMEQLSLLASNGRSEVHRLVEKGREWYTSVTQELMMCVYTSPVVSVLGSNVLVIKANEMVAKPTYAVTSAISQYLNDNPASVAGQGVDCVAVDSGKGISLRLPNQSSTFDLPSLAKQLGGGGHAKACGCDRDQFWKAVGANRKSSEPKRSFTLVTRLMLLTKWMRSLV